MLEDNPQEFVGKIEDAHGDCTETIQVSVCEVKASRKLGRRSEPSSGYILENRSEPRLGPARREVQTWRKVV